MDSDAIAILDGGSKAYILMLQHMVTIIEDAATPETAVNALRETISPDLVKHVVVMSDTYQQDRSCVEALQKAGYTNIRCVTTLCVIVNSSLLQAPLKCVIDEPVCALYSDSVVVIKKCEIGWQLVGVLQGLCTALNRHPSIRNVFMLEETPELMALKKSRPDIAFHLAALDDEHLKPIYIPNYVNNIKTDCHVFSTCSVDLYVSFSNKCETIKLTDRIPPFTVTEEFDVGDAPQVTIYALLPSEVGKKVNPPIVKTFNFKYKAFRNVSITVTVDETLLPQVTLKTVSTYDDPAVKPNPGVYLVVCERNIYSLAAVYPDRKTNEGRFDSAEELVAYMNKTFSKASPSTIYFTEFPFSVRNDLKNVCLNAGFPNVEFIVSESIDLSILLDFAQVTVEPNELVAVIDPYHYRVICRDGKRIKILKQDASSNFDINKVKFATVIINSPMNLYTKTDLNTLCAKFSQCAVKVVSEWEQLKKRLPKYLWSLANETDFGGNFFYNFGGFQFAIKENGTIMESVDIARFTRFPYVLTVTYHVRFADKLHLYLQTLNGTVMEKVDEYSVKLGNVVQLTITVITSYRITTNMDILYSFVTQWNGSKRSLRELPLPKKKRKKRIVESFEATEPKNIPSTSGAIANTADADASLPKQLSELTLNPPNAIFTFTSDNRVLIEADETYSGVKEVLAYVRLRVGKEPQVGTKAFDALKKHPASVFYDITRLLATDFDPDQPDPSWGFKTARDADGKVVIRSADDITTFPIVLFGLVIQSTLLYIREHTKSDVKSIGLKLPTGSTVSPDELKEVSKRIGVELSLIVTFS